MDVIRTAVDGMQFPTANAAMVVDGLFDDFALRLI